jgi:ArsR family metal-binding transcriptional regulator
LKLTAGEMELEQCPPLFTETHRAKSEKLLALLEGAQG